VQVQVAIHISGIFLKGQNQDQGQGQTALKKNSVKKSLFHYLLGA
jgi:hypothetical protein